jgi:hypothetical protein
MANQIQATVYQIDGSPLNNSIQIAFLTSNVYMREFQTDLIPAVNSAIVYYPNTNNQLQEQTFLVSETITALVSSANTGGTTQISTTVLEINQEPQIPSGLTFSFPVQGISIWPVSDPVVGGVNSYLEFKNKKYYLLEDEAALVTAANAGGGGGSTSTGINGLNGTTSIGLGGQLDGNTVILGLDFSLNMEGLSELVFGSADANNYYQLVLNTNGSVLNTYNILDDLFTSMYVTNKNIYTKYGTNFAGIALDFDSEFYTLGDSSTFIKSDSQNNEIILSITPKINTGTITNTATATIPTQYLSININGADKKIQIFNP